MKILVVEDDPVDLELIVWSLRAGGYTVDLAKTGQDGLSAARTAAYDVIVLDLMLPDINGIEIVRQLRAEHRSVPILLLTATTAVETRVEALDAGADDYLTKPFDIGELRARLRALTRRGEPAMGDDISFGPLVLRRPAGALHLGGRPLPVTPKEYALLECFMLRPGEVVSRDELLASGWDASAHPRSGVIDKHIARLRAKLRAHPTAPQLETVRGEGFRLAVRPSPVPRG